MSAKGTMQYMIYSFWIKVLSISKRNLGKKIMDTVLALSCHKISTFVQRKCLDRNQPVQLWIFWQLSKQLLMIQLIIFLCY